MRCVFEVIGLIALWNEYRKELLLVSVLKRFWIERVEVEPAEPTYVEESVLR
jgi:hypothetical protein